MRKTINCILIRHGQTQGNIEKRYIGCRTDEALSPVGIEEIRQIKKEHPAMIPANTQIKLFSSPLIRAKETAELLFPETEIHIVDGLKEMDFGFLEGKNYAELDGNPDYQQFIDSRGRFPAPGGESKEEFAKRTMQGFLRCLDYLSKDTGTEGASETAVIVCHGGSIMTIMSILTGKEDIYDFHVNNLGGYRLTLDYDPPTVKLEKSQQLT